MSAWPVVQRLVALAALTSLLPLMAALAIAVRLSSRGPSLHRAIRFSPDGPFVLYKFRTMQADGEGLGVTAAGDRRITRIGHYLRSSKVDELPQLWNVLRGQMLLVGPRPEDPRFIDWEDPLHRLVFSVTPGITSPASIFFRSEEAMLTEEASMVASDAGRQRPALEDVERAYRERILPRKLRLDADYVLTRTWRGDVWILARTIRQVLRVNEDS